MKQENYKILIRALIAYKNCLELDIESKWEQIWLERIEYIQDNILPYGSGIDADNKIDIETSNANQIIINSSYHVLSNNGFYTHWIDYKVKITTNLLYLNVSVIGKFRKNQIIKDYLQELYHDCLTERTNLFKNKGTITPKNIK